MLADIFLGKIDELVEGGRWRVMRQEKGAKWLAN
jgi:hypothetical protein